MNKKTENRKVKEKLNLAFSILYFFEPLSFHYLKSFQKKEKIKNSLRLKLKKLKQISINYHLKIFYNKQIKTKEKKKILKNYFFQLSACKNNLRQTLKFREKEKQTFSKKKKIFSNKILREEVTNVTKEIKSLEDFLNV